MPEKTAIKTNNYAVVPVSTILAVVTMLLLFLKAFGIIAVPWWVVFSPIIIWLGIVFSAGLIIISVISIVALVQIWK